MRLAVFFGLVALALGATGVYGALRPYRRCCARCAPNRYACLAFTIVILSASILTFSS